jgi:hypothetical protein
VSFRGFGEYQFRSNLFAEVEFPKNWEYDNLFDWIMAWLKEEWIPNSEQEKWIYVSR